MLGLFRTHPMYSIVEVQPDVYEVYYRQGNFFWYYHIVATDVDGNILRFEGLDIAKSFLRTIDMYYYTDLEIKYLKDYK